MLKRSFLFVIILLFSNQLYSQEKDVNNEPGVAIYYEMGGKFFHSANLDFPINKSNRWGVGVSPTYGDIVPTIMYYHLGGEKSGFELGGGLGYVIILTDDDHDDFKGITFHGVIGYRYQKKNGLLFRAGFTPFIFSDVFAPFIGLSFGYSW